MSGPIIDSAMRCITSEAMPMPHMIGSGQERDHGSGYAEGRFLGGFWVMAVALRHRGAMAAAGAIAAIEATWSPASTKCDHNNARIAKIEKSNSQAMALVSVLVSLRLRLGRTGSLDLDQPKGWKANPC